MKRLLLTILVFVVLTPLAAFADVNNFSFRLFDAEYTVGRTEEGYSRMQVRERLIAQFPDFDQNRGIERAIPKTYRGENLDISNVTVTNNDGQSLPFSTYTSNDNLVIRIGQENVFVRGEQTYIINYSLSNVITFEEGFDELFWNVNGTQWKQRFEEVRASIYIPSQLAASLQDRQRCYSGPEGSLAENCTINRSVDGEGNVTITTAALSLAPTENLSFVLAWDDDTFVKDPWPMIKFWLNVAAGAGIVLFTLGYMWYRWNKYGKDPSGRGVIVAQYVPPKDLSILEGDTIINERLSTKAISAALIELATKKYLFIHEHHKKKLIGSDSEYELELVKKPSDLHQDYQEVIAMVFGDGAIIGDKVKLEDKANKLYKDVQKLQKEIPARLSKAGYFRKDPNSSRTRHYGWGVGLIIAGFGLAFIAIGLGVGVMIAGVIIMIFAPIMPARTQKGVEAREYLLGLKEYIDLAEADRLKFLQSPEGVKQYGDPTKKSNKIHLFESLLPYAMLFGLEKQWAKEFGDLYEQPPDWYSGNRGAFNAIYLANSINNINSSANTAFTAPSSSGGSGFSGGGSGGGGGGGGGGGW